MFMFIAAKPCLATETKLSCSGIMTIYLGSKENPKNVDADFTHDLIIGEKKILYQKMTGTIKPIDDGKLYIGTIDGRNYSLDRVSGKFTLLPSESDRSYIETICNKVKTKF